WAEMTDYVYVHCLNQKGPNSEKELDEGLESICVRHGLRIPRVKDGDNAGKGDEDKLEMVNLALSLLCEKVHAKKDGKPLDPKTPMNWIEDFSKGGDGKGNPTHWQQSLDAVLAAKYGGNAAFSGRIVLLLVKAFGLHYPEAFFHGRTFEYTMTVPGEIIDSN